MDNYETGLAELKELDQHWAALCDVRWRQGDVLRDMGWGNLSRASKADVAQKANQKMTTLQLRWELATAFPPERRLPTIPYSAYVQFLRIKDIKARNELMESREEWTVELAEAKVRDWLIDHKKARTGSRTIRTGASVAGLGKVEVVLTGGRLEITIPAGVVGKVKTHDMGDRVELQMNIAEA